MYYYVTHLLGLINIQILIKVMSLTLYFFIPVIVFSSPIFEELVSSLEEIDYNSLFTFFISHSVRLKFYCILIKMLATGVKD